MKFERLGRQLLLSLTARSSRSYWERRYRAGMTSGAGSYGELAQFKAEVLNDFVAVNGVEHVIEFGCGDGNQLSLARYPKYLGIDVSPSAVDACARRFAGDASKAFLLYDPARAINLGKFLAADLTLSLDVIYHLIEDEAYDSHLRDLFATSRRFVIIYSSDRPAERTAPHVRHRQFSGDVARRFPQFRLERQIENRHPEQSFASFFVYARMT